MFGVFFHPKSVARQREVPELSVPAPVHASAAGQILMCVTAPEEKDAVAPLTHGTSVRGRQAQKALEGWIAVYRTAIRTPGAM